MSDNVKIPAQGTGDTEPVVAADDIGGIKYQRVKLSLGGDGTAADAASGAGVVDATVQRVTLGSDDPAVVDLNKIAAQVLDYDTGAGTANQAIYGLALPASGGPVAGGTPTNPINVRDAAQQLAASTWTQVHVPASATQATKSQASAGGSLRNVCTGFTVTVCANGTAPVPTTPVTVQVVDGATGGTTYLWRTNITMPAVAGGIVSINRTGLWLVGSAATAMTIEFSAAGPTNTYQSVAMDGVIVSG